MLVAQGWLAKSGRIEQHRSMGRLSYFLAPIIVVGFILVTNVGQLKHKDTGLFGATFFDGGLFVVLYILGIINRKNTDFHSRYMILTALPFINPGLGRFIAFLVTAYVKKKPYKPYLVGLGAFFLLLGFVVYISLIDPTIIESIWIAFWG
jgi:hypothetical protein